MNDIAESNWRRLDAITESTKVGDCYTGNQTVSIQAPTLENKTGLEWNNGWVPIIRDTQLIRSPYARYRTKRVVLK